MQHNKIYNNKRHAKWGLLCYVVIESSTARFARCDIQSKQILKNERMSLDESDLR